MTDPAIVQAPFGPEVDGRRLLNEAVGFGRALRAARLAIDIGAAVDFARALTLVDIGDREQVRGAGEAIFVRRRDDRVVYDAVFDRWWRRRNARHAGRLRAAAAREPQRRRRGRAGRDRPGRAAARHGRHRQPVRRARDPDPVRERRRGATTPTSRGSSSRPTPTARARSCGTASSTG